MVVSNNTCMYTHRASRDKTRAVCRCDKGWVGTDCGIQQPFWNNWGPWGRCEPECGNPRHRRRQRSCGITTKPCVGDPEDFMNCAPRICVTDGKTEYHTSMEVLLIVSYFIECQNIVSNHNVYEL